jgi:hypothetical protein
MSNFENSFLDLLDLVQPQYVTDLLDTHCSDLCVTYAITLKVSEVFLQGTLFVMAMLSLTNFAEASRDRQLLAGADLELFL